MALAISGACAIRTGELFMTLAKRGTAGPTRYSYPYCPRNGESVKDTAQRPTTCASRDGIA